MDDIAEEADVTPLQGPKLFRFKGIDYNGTTHDSMTLREPTIGDLQAMRKKVDSIDQMAVLITRTSGLPPLVVDKLTQTTLEAAGDYFAGFSPPSPEAGKS